MRLVPRAGSRPHSVRAFRAAAGARYREASRLANAGHRLGAIYLYGYVAEMLLKAAYFRLRGWGPLVPIAHHDLNQAKTRALTHFHLGSVWTGNLHDLRGWAALLVRERAFLGQRLPRPLANQLGARVNCVYRNWREYLRYHDMRPYAGELIGTRAAVNWMLTQYRRL